VSIWNEDVQSEYLIRHWLYRTFARKRGHGREAWRAKSLASLLFIWEFDMLAEALVA
jgi:hypothetical protein